jgi:hypothetical protein
MNSRTLSVVVVGLAIVIVSCGSSSDFDAKGILEANPVTLDGEQLTLSSKDVDCGVQAELWDSPSTVSQERNVARLSSKARELKFNDDVSIVQNSQPYVQIWGAFPLQVEEVTEVRAGGESDTKIVTAKVGVKIQHQCFQNPLSLMGVKKGNFQLGAPASFLLRQTKDSWKVEKVVH